MSAAERNKNLVRRLVEIVNDRELDAIDEVATGQIAREAARWVGPFARSFPDFRMELVDVIAEPDKVVGYFKCSGTHEGRVARHPTQRPAVRGRRRGLHLPGRGGQAVLRGRRRGGQPHAHAPARTSAVTPAVGRPVSGVHTNRCSLEVASSSQSLEALERELAELAAHPRRDVPMAVPAG